MPTTDTTAALQQLAGGLLYPSETDAPWGAFAWPSAQGEPARASVLKLGGHTTKAPVEEQALDDFFVPLVQEQNWYGPEEKTDAARNRALLDGLKRLLATPKVFK